MTNLKKIVVIGGGTGTFSVLQALRDGPSQVTAIVSTADDGGSTGVLRDELGVLPPGDLRQALVALSTDSQVLRDLFTYRFTEGSLDGHSFGNLLLSALEKVTGRFDQAVLEAGKILAIRGKVVPVTTDQMRLIATTSNGGKVNGEHAIEEHIWSGGPDVVDMRLAESCQLHPLAKQAILEADLIVIAPGSIFTSLIPNLLVAGMKEALRQTKAKLAYVVNLMTEKGQTGSYTVDDFVSLLERYLGPNMVDFAIYNTRKPSKELLERYKKEMERTPVLLGTRSPRRRSYQLVGANLLRTKPPTVPQSADKLAVTRTLIRHDARKLAHVLSALVYLKEAEKYLR
jgi:uncharacterized cofD-like protein